MAKTRTQIKAAVHLNTGRGTEKASLIETACDEALKLAQESHNFEDGLTYDSDFVITTSAVSVDISTLTNIVDIVSATIIETAGSQNRPFYLHDEAWWNLNVVNASDNEEGWPTNGIRRGSTVYLDRPSQSGLTLRLVAARKMTFAGDSSECPIGILDLFVTQYVTAMVFASIEAYDKATFWYTLALGPDYTRENKIGGTLLAAINKDKKDSAKINKASRGGLVGQSGVSILNQIEGHPNYGHVELWSRS